MTKKIPIGRLAGLNLTVDGRFFTGLLILWAVLGGAGFYLLDLPPFQALVGGLVAALLFPAFEIIHQLGHAVAARRTGYPMAGIHLGTLLFLGTSIYPEDEGDLPAAVHIRRALGGPQASLLFSAITGVVAYWLYPAGGLAWWLALYAALVNLLVFTLGSFLPLGFTDGSTILTWWGRR